MSAILAVDPGDPHCGVAVFADGACRYTATMTPHELFDWWAVGAALYGGVKQRWDVVVVEAFRLYPSAAKAQINSSFPTVEVIGVLRERSRKEHVTFVVQGASIKKPTRAILRAHKVRVAGKGPHAKDAFIHGSHYLMRAKR